MSTTTEAMFIVWHETSEGVTHAELKDTKRKAVIAYNKLGRSGKSHTLKSYGWSYANEAEPMHRRAVGLPPFPKVRVPMA